MSNIKKIFMACPNCVITYEFSFAEWGVQEEEHTCCTSCGARLLRRQDSPESMVDRKLTLCREKDKLTLKPQVSPSAKKLTDEAFTKITKTMLQRFPTVVVDEIASPEILSTLTDLERKAKK